MKSEIEELNLDPQRERAISVIEMIAQSFMAKSFYQSFLYFVAASAQIIFYTFSSILALFLILGYYLIARGTPVQFEVYQSIIMAWAIFAFTSLFSRGVVKYIETYLKKERTMITEIRAYTRNAWKYLGLKSDREGN